MNNDIYDLIAQLVDPENECDSDEYLLEGRLYSVYGIDLEDFTKLINNLLPLCRFQKSSLTNKFYQGFGTDNFWIYKHEITE